MRTPVAWVFIALLMLVACYPGKSPRQYQAIDACWSWKLIALGDERYPVAQADTVWLVGHALQDKSQRGEPVVEQVLVDQKDHPWQPCLRELYQGDSLHLMTICGPEKADTLYYQFRVTLDRASAVCNSSEHVDWGDSSFYQATFEVGTFDTTHHAGGIIKSMVKEGRGDLLKGGDHVQVRYRGFFQDGTCFDSSTIKTPFDFRIGDPDQVIEGLEVALLNMRVSETALWWIPSELAFGPSGSSSGQIPPHTPLIFRLHVIERFDVTSQQSNDSRQ